LALGFWALGFVIFSCFPFSRVIPGHKLVKLTRLDLSFFYVFYWFNFGPFFLGFFFKFNFLSRSHIACHGLVEGTRIGFFSRCFFSYSWFFFIFLMFDFFFHLLGFGYWPFSFVIFSLGFKKYSFFIPISYRRSRSSRVNSFFFYSSIFKIDFFFNFII